MRNLTSRFAASLVLLGAIACGPKDDPQNAPKPAPPKVNLPPSPSMVEPKFVEKYADGSYTVAGLVRGRSKTMRKAVRVKGVVLSVHRCAETEPECDPPAHAVLVDDAARPMERLFVVGNDLTVFPTLENGASPILEGDYLESDPAGKFVRMDGVLVLHLAPDAAAPAAPVAPAGEPTPTAPTPAGDIVPGVPGGDPASSAAAPKVVPGAAPAPGSPATAAPAVAPEPAK